MNRTVGRRVRAAVWAGGSLAALAGGCTRIDYHVSAPDALPAGLTGDVDGAGHARIRLGELKLTVSALDSTPDVMTDFLIVPIKTKQEPRPIPGFAILLVFQPAVLGYSYDPTRASLDMEGGGAVKPTAYVGPGQVECVPFYTFSECNCVYKRGYELSRQTEARSYPLPVGRTCFAVAFDARLVPPATAVLTVDGITKGYEAVALPGIRFVRRAAHTSSFENVPPALSGR